MQWNKDVKSQGGIAGVVAALVVLALGKTVFPLACIAAVTMFFFANESYFRFASAQLNYVRENWDDFQGKGDLGKILKGNKYYQAGKEHYIGQLARNISTNRHIGWFLALTIGAVCWFWGEVIVLVLVAGISGYLIIKFAAGDSTIDLSAEGNLSASSV